MSDDYKKTIPWLYWGAGRKYDERNAVLYPKLYEAKDHNTTLDIIMDWNGISWRQHVLNIKTAARALIGLGITPGQKICLIGNTRQVHSFHTASQVFTLLFGQSWLEMHVGALMVGAVPFSIYNTCSKSEVEVLLGHSDATLVLVEGACVSCYPCKHNTITSTHHAPPRATHAHHAPHTCHCSYRTVFHRPRELGQG